MNSNKIGAGTIICLVAVLLTGIVAGVMLERKTSGATTRSVMGLNDKLTYTMDLIDTKYVDDISHDSLVNLVVPELIKKLDPHSSYIPAEDLADTNEPLVGKFDGIGVMFNMLTDTALITNVITGGPSNKAGVVAGDRIIEVNDSIVAGVKLDSDKLVKKLRGTRGTKVKIGVQRAGGSTLTQIPITRGVIPMKSLDAAFIIDDSVGFVKFSRFAATTYTEIMDAMKQLSNNGAKSFIIDLRGNGGGYLDQAILIANEFLDKDQIIVYTEGVHSPKRIQYADGTGKYKSVPLVVMIDEISASASEILSGAIQDNDRGIIVGRRSFGKGLVQDQISYPDGSAMRITIARYYTPAGRSIQKPYKAGESDEYFMELYNRAKHSELFNVDSIKQNKDLRFVTPKGKVVYGGGGVMPDEFVPLDTTGLTPYFRKAFEKNLIFKYATKLTEDNRTQINTIKTFDQLAQFLDSRNIFPDFVAYASRNGLDPMPAQAEKNRSLITAQIKGYVGRNTSLEDSALYYYTYPEDVTTMTAISIIKQAK